MQRKIRILHVVDTLSIGSGVMSFIMNYYRNIDRETFQFDFLYMIESDNSYKEEIESLYGNVYFIKIPGIKKLALFTKEVNTFFIKNSNKYEAIHLHQLNIGFIIFPVAKKYGIKSLIMHAHATKYSDRPINCVRNFILFKMAKKFATHYLACSKAAAFFIFGKSAVNSGLVKIINNAIDINRFKYDASIRTNIRKQMNIEDKFIIGHIGRFEEPKNHEFLIDVFSKVLKIVPESNLVLVGEGSLINRINSKIQQLGLDDNVIFMGVREDIDKLFLCMDVFVLPSLFEGFGMVLIEAQASGLPCLASDTVSIETKITKSIKYISLKESAEVWANEILNLFQNHPREPNSFSDAIYKYNIESQVKQLEETYLNNVRK